MKTWVPVVLACSSAVIFGLSNVMYKLGLRDFQSGPISRFLSVRVLFELLSSRPFATALLLTGLAGLLYVLAISQGEVTVAVATLSISYIVTALLAWRMLGEQLTVVRVLGLLMIMGGVLLVNST